MKPEMTRPTWEDVVFESRNKDYGAYSIRKSYDENVLRASILSICLAALVFGAFQVASLMRIEIKVTSPNVDRLEWTVLPKIVPVQSKQKVISRHDKNVRKDLPVKVVKHDVLDPPAIKPVDLPQIGNDKGNTTTVDADIKTTGVETNTVTTPVLEPKIFDHPEVMPTYEGGVIAMVRFISRSIRYPGAARALGQEGTVYVRFVVNNLGQVVDVEVVRGVSAVLDKEAMRVVTLMNKWTPGLQNNVPVNVHMVLPIRFQLEQ